MDCWIYLAVLYQPFFEIMNYYEQKHAAFMQHAEKLKSFGFRVFVSTSKNFPNYGKFCDKRGILGYFQLSEFLFGVDFSTLHHGSKQLGYGLSCCRNGKELRDLYDFTLEDALVAFSDDGGWCRQAVGNVRKILVTDTSWQGVNGMREI
ncbi:hypothetical protein [Bacteroides pyogenes]|uniref:hypothetical protein n=1 Tax=Bacteroides pyogenes TaxID=310300 RepID=UPI002FD91D15